jgi:outer membrane protein OmpA-like peptidoglycan-associated protein
MYRYDTYSVAAAEAPALRRWMLVTFVLSIGLHGALFAYLNSTYVRGLVFTEENLKVTKPMNLKRVTIPDMPADKPAPPPQTVAPKLNPLVLPADKPVIEGEVQLAPQIADLGKAAFTDKPRLDSNVADRLAKTEANARQQMDKQLSANLGDLLKETPRISARQARVSTGRRQPGEGEGTAGVPGLNSVDDLLSHAGALKVGERAAMSGGALFEYDSADLLPAAIDSLRKLGVLIQQNPKITFSIEGHTDSYGGPEYNAQLSLRRAEAVKAWLVVNMRIPPERIQTRGFGSSKLLVPAERSQEEQAPNRRVEIVLKTNTGARRG